MTAPHPSSAGRRGVAFRDPQFAVVRRATFPLRLVEAGVPSLDDVQRSDPELRRAFDTAIDVASPSLSAATRREVARDGAQATRALERYLLRATSRATPFGVFAAYAHVERGSATALTVSRPLDLRVLWSRGDASRETHQLTPLHWRVGARLRYLALTRDGSTSDGEAEATALCELPWTPTMAAVLAALEPCRSRESAIAALMSLGLTADAAAATYAQLEPTRLFAAAPSRPLLLPAPDDSDPGKRLADFRIGDAEPGASIWARDPQPLRMGPALRSAFANAAELMARVAQPFAIPALPTWRAAFEARFEGARVPLLQAMDPLCGVPLGSLALEAMPMPPRWLATLTRIATRARDTGDTTIQLQAEELDGLTHSVMPQWPGAHLLATVHAWSDKAVDAGEFVVRARGVCGADGLRLLGRFADGDAALVRDMRAHSMRLGQSIGDDVLVAEVVHGLRGNEAATGRRVSPHQYAIACATRCATSAGESIGLHELSLFSDGRQLHLWSERHGKRVVPRITSAQVPSVGAFLEVYRLLDALQYGEGPVAYQWVWTGLEHLPFTPGLSVGPVELCAPAWRVRGGDPLATRIVTDGVAGGQSAQPPLPRRLCLRDGEERWPVDLGHDDSRAQLDAHWRHDRTVVLEHSAEQVATLPVRDADGDAYVSEFVVPLIAEDRPHDTRAVRVPQPFCAQTHTASCGRGWLYAQLLAPYAAHGRILTRLRDRLPVTARRNCFVVRYGEPSAQLRLRVRTPTAGSAQTELRRDVEAVCTQLLEEGLAADVVFPTYVREVDRYGGLEAMHAAETSFMRQTALLWSTLGPTGTTAPDEALALGVMFADGLRRAWFRCEALQVSAQVLQRWDTLPRAAEWRTRTRSLRSDARAGSIHGYRAWGIGARLGTSLRRLAVHAADRDLQVDLYGSHVHMVCNRLFDTDWEAREYAVWCALRALDQRRVAPRTGRVGR